MADNEQPDYSRYDQYQRDCKHPGPFFTLTICPTCGLTLDDSDWPQEDRLLFETTMAGTNKTMYATIDFIHHQEYTK